MDYSPLEYNGHGNTRTAPSPGYEHLSVNLEWLVGGRHPSEITNPPGQVHELSWDRVQQPHCDRPCNK